MHMRFQDRVIKRWVRKKKLSPENLIHKIYNESPRLSQEGHDTWADRVDNITSYSTVMTSINKLTKCVNDGTPNVSAIGKTITESNLIYSTMYGTRIIKEHSHDGQFPQT